MARAGEKTASRAAARHIARMADRIDPVQIAPRGGSHGMEPMHRAISPDSKGMEHTEGHR